MRLIDADALIEYLDKYVITTKPIAVFFKDIIDDAPTISDADTIGYMLGYGQGKADALKAKPSTDTISRAEVLYLIDDAWVRGTNLCTADWLVDEIKSLQSTEAVQGEWILVKGSNGKDYHKCSKCLHTQEITGVKNYCAVCGARMKGGDSE